MIELAFWAAHPGWNRGSPSEGGKLKYSGIWALQTNTIICEERLRVADFSGHASVSVNVVFNASRYRLFDSLGVTISENSQIDTLCRTSFHSASPCFFPWALMQTIKTHFTGGIQPQRAIQD
jgi:hypothetical protein